MAKATKEDFEHKLYDKAVKFATKAHEGQTRKGTDLPYIVHPLEVAEIVQGMTDDENVWAAAVLHDTVEDTPVTMEDIKREFGEKVAHLVAGDTENKRDDLPPEQTWKIRKQETIDHLNNDADRKEKMIVIGDKLSNIRQIYKDEKELGPKFWNRFHQKDKNMHAWYYHSVIEATKDLADTEAWQELNSLAEEVFGKEDSNKSS